MMAKCTKKTSVFGKLEVCAIYSSGASSFTGCEVTAEHKIQESWLSRTLRAKDGEDNSSIFFVLEEIHHQFSGHFQKITINNLKRKITIDFDVFKLFKNTHYWLFVDDTVTMIDGKIIKLSPKKFNRKYRWFDLVFIGINHLLHYLLDLFIFFTLDCLII